jgi:hypothetical protein
MRTDEFIRSRAKLNWSRKMVADALGMDYQKLRVLVADHMSDIKWCATHESVDWIRARKARRGHCEPALSRAAAMGRQARYNQAEKHNIAGFIGTTREIYDAWREYISVSLCQVRRRLSKGVTALDAFFKPNETHLGWGQNGKFWQ